MADVKSATLPTGTKVQGPARVVDVLVARSGGEAEKPAPKKPAVKKSAAKKH